MSQWYCSKCDDNYDYCLLEGKGQNKPQHCPYTEDEPEWKECKNE